MRMEIPQRNGIKRLRERPRHSSFQAPSLTNAARSNTLAGMNAVELFQDLALVRIF